MQAVPALRPSTRRRVMVTIASPEHHAQYDAAAGSAFFPHPQRAPPMLIGVFWEGRHYSSSYATYYRRFTN